MKNWIWAAPKFQFFMLFGYNFMPMPFLIKSLFYSSMLLVHATLIASTSEEDYVRHVQAHLLIKDAHSAVKEAKKALREYPDNPILFEWTIRSLAALGEDGEMISIWEMMSKRFEKEAMDQDLLEEMCWGILQKGKSASGISTQLICLIGAALGNDMKAIPFLLEGLCHSNARLRQMAVELSAHYGDQPLREELSRMLREEAFPDIRVGVIKAIGKLQIEENLPQLIQAVAHPKTGAKEKQAAIEAIILMQEKPESEELKILSKSERAGLRELAAEIIGHYQLKDQVRLLEPLIQDPHPEVCAAAICAWGLLKQPATKLIKQFAFFSLDPIVGITASWCWLIDQSLDPSSNKAEEAMERWLCHPQAKIRALGAAAVASTGSYGVNLSKKFLDTTEDPYVRINLALGLAGQREATEKICAVLDDCLKNNHDRWMFEEAGIFRVLQKSTINHSPKGANYPEIINQSVRLEVLNLLAILEYPTALESIKQFLIERKWGVTGLAAEALLGEGDETAIDLVRQLLNDPDKEIRIEAALVLATWAKDHTAVPLLLEAYPKADRQLQLKILESLGSVGDRKIIPFLIERLKEPSLMIRMIAACIMIQTLNH